MSFPTAPSDDKGIGRFPRPIRKPGKVLFLPATCEPPEHPEQAELRVVHERIDEQSGHGDEL